MAREFTIYIRPKGKDLESEEIRKIYSEKIANAQKRIGGEYAGFSNLIVTENRKFRFKDHLNLESIATLAIFRKNFPFLIIGVLMSVGIFFSTTIGSIFLLGTLTIGAAYFNRKKINNFFIRVWSKIKKKDVIQLRFKLSTAIDVEEKLKNSKKNVVSRGIKKTYKRAKSFLIKNKAQKLAMDVRKKDDVEISAIEFEETKKEQLNLADEAKKFGIQVDHLEDIQVLKLETNGIVLDMNFGDDPGEIFKNKIDEFIQEKKGKTDAAIMSSRESLEFFYEEKSKESKEKLTKITEFSEKGYFVARLKKLHESHFGNDQEKKYIIDEAKTQLLGYKEEMINHLVKKDKQEEYKKAQSFINCNLAQKQEGLKLTQEVQALFDYIEYDIIIERTFFGEVPLSKEAHDKYIDLLEKIKDSNNSLKSLESKISIEELKKEAIRLKELVDKKVDFIFEGDAMENIMKKANEHQKSTTLIPKINKLKQEIQTQLKTKYTESKYEENRRKLDAPKKNHLKEITVSAAHLVDKASNVFQANFKNKTSKISNEEVKEIQISELEDIIGKIEEIIEKAKNFEKSEEKNIKKIKEKISYLEQKLNLNPLENNQERYIAFKDKNFNKFFISLRNVVENFEIKKTGKEKSKGKGIYKALKDLIKYLDENENKIDFIKINGGETLYVATHLKDQNEINSFDEKTLKLFEEEEKEDEYKKNLNPFEEEEELEITNPFNENPNTQQISNYEKTLELFEEEGQNDEVKSISSKSEKGSISINIMAQSDDSGLSTTEYQGENISIDNSSVFSEIKPDNNSVYIAQFDSISNKEVPQMESSFDLSKRIQHIIMHANFSGGKERYLKISLLANSLENNQAGVNQKLLDELEKEIKHTEEKLKSQKSKTKCEKIYTVLEQLVPKEKDKKHSRKVS